MSYSVLDIKDLPWQLASIREYCPANMEIIGISYDYQFGNARILCKSVRGKFRGFEIRDFGESCRKKITYYDSDFYFLPLQPFVEFDDIVNEVLKSRVKK